MGSNTQERPVVSLMPSTSGVGAAVMSDGVEVVSLPPHMCIKWATILLQASGLQDLKLDSSNVRFIGNIDQ